MNVLICEDEKVFSGLLKKRLEAFLASKGMPGEIRQFSEGAPLEEHLRTAERADLLFMDIQLGGEDGVELVKRIRVSHPKLPVIFLTSMEDRIGEGYDVSAFYFLLKKDFEEKLPTVMERFLKEVFTKKSLYVPCGSDAVLVDFADVYYAEADGRGTGVHCKSSVLPCGTSIQSFSRMLPADQFIEIYHCLYVNADHIHRVNADNLELDNGQTLPVSRRKRKDLMNAIMRRIQNR